MAAILVKENGAEQMYYTNTDHLGSLTEITDNTGTLIQRIVYNAWGERELFVDNTNTGKFLFDRGFTGHEHLDEFGLINMNGRMYDPILGVMLSPDNYVQNPYGTQGFNRYSYAGNNPLVFTDPSGEFAWVPFLIITAWNAAMSADNMARQYSRMGKDPTAGAITGAVIGIGTSFLGMGMGALGTTLGITGALPGAAWGAVSGGIAGGLTGGVTYYALTGDFWSGAKVGAISGGIMGGVMGGISGYRSAVEQGRNPWTGVRDKPAPREFYADKQGRKILVKQIEKYKKWHSQGRTLTAGQKRAIERTYISSLQQSSYKYGSFVDERLSIFLGKDVRSVTISAEGFPVEDITTYLRVDNNTPVPYNFDTYELHGWSPVTYENATKASFNTYGQFLLKAQKGIYFSSTYFRIIVLQ